MPKRLKCYIGNLDGLRQGLIMAYTQRQAAETIGVSLYGFRQYWGECLVPEGLTPKPLTLYTRLYRYSVGADRADREKWREGRVTLAKVDKWTG